jgi:hypothetical protein
VVTDPKMEVSVPHQETDRNCGNPQKSTGSEGNLGSQDALQRLQKMFKVFQLSSQQEMLYIRDILQHSIVVNILQGLSHKNVSGIGFHSILFRNLLGRTAMADARHRNFAVPIACSKEGKP